MDVESGQGLRNPRWYCSMLLRRKAGARNNPLKLHQPNKSVVNWDVQNCPWTQRRHSDFSPPQSTFATTKLTRKW